MSPIDDISKGPSPLLYDADVSDTSKQLELHKKLKQLVTSKSGDQTSVSLAGTPPLPGKPVLQSPELNMSSDSLTLMLMDLQSKMSQQQLGRAKDMVLMSMNKSQLAQMQGFVHQMDGAHKSGKLEQLFQWVADAAILVAGVAATVASGGAAAPLLAAALTTTVSVLSQSPALNKAVTGELTKLFQDLGLPHDDAEKAAGIFMAAAQVAVAVGATALTGGAGAGQAVTTIENVTKGIQTAETIVQDGQKILTEAKDLVGAMEEAGQAIDDVIEGAQDFFKGIEDGSGDERRKAIQEVFKGLDEGAEAVDRGAKDVAGLSETVGALAQLIPGLQDAAFEQTLQTISKDAKAVEQVTGKVEKVISDAQAVTEDLEQISKAFGDIVEGSERFIGGLRSGDHDDRADGWSEILKGLNRGTEAGEDLTQDVVQGSQDITSIPGLDGPAAKEFAQRIAKNAKVVQQALEKARKVGEDAKQVIKDVQQGVIAFDDITEGGQRFVQGMQNGNDLERQDAWEEFIAGFQQGGDVAQQIGGDVGKVIGDVDGKSTAHQTVSGLAHYAATTAQGSAENAVGTTSNDLSTEALNKNMMRITQTIGDERRKLEKIIRELDANMTQTLEGSTKAQTESFDMQKFRQMI